MTEQFARRLADVIGNRESLADFQRWFIPFVLGPNVDPEDEGIALDTENLLAQYSGGLISSEVVMRTLGEYAKQPIIFRLYALESRRRVSSMNQTVISELVRVSA